MSPAEKLVTKIPSVGSMSPTKYVQTIAHQYNISITELKLLTRKLCCIIDWFCLMYNALVKFIAIVTHYLLFTFQCYHSHIHHHPSVYILCSIPVRLYYVGDAVAQFANFNSPSICNQLLYYVPYLSVCCWLYLPWAIAAMALATYPLLFTTRSIRCTV